MTNQLVVAVGNLMIRHKIRENMNVPLILSNDHLITLNTVYPNILRIGNPSADGHYIISSAKWEVPVLDNM